MSKSPTPTTHQQPASPGLLSSWNWEKVLAKVQIVLPSFIRSRPEIDKETLLAQRDEEILRFGLAQCGMKVVQDESFFIEPALADTEARQSTPANN